jgi:hypothetical protein
MAVQIPALDATAWKWFLQCFSALHRHGLRFNQLHLSPLISFYGPVDEIEHGIAEFARGPNGGLIVVGPPSSVAPSNRDLIVRLAIQHHLPAIFATPAFVSAGGLIFYGSDPITDYRRAAERKSLSRTGGADDPTRR